MNNSDAARQFAIDVVRRLQAAGFQALWAGGCVRDQLMGHKPKDYDVATNAKPTQVRELFGHDRTLAIGESFGVISVLGPRAAGQIDVATFRQDDTYSDGRHPDSIRFSTAELDAQRRDFTINGLFFDPITNQVLDYVDGQIDLQAKIIRAIGDPAQRIAEDRLRMLRAVRFAARFNFEIETETLSAIRQSAPQIVQVSGERIANELRLMLSHQNRHLAFDLLRGTRLLDVLLPERIAGSNERLSVVTSSLAQLQSERFESALSVILYDLPERALLIADVSRRWRMSNDESSAIEWITGHVGPVQTADQRPWPTVQRMLVHPLIQEAIAVSETIPATFAATSGIKFCRERLAWPTERLNPPPLIDGNDLRSLNVPPGPIFRKILEIVRDGQLRGELADKQQALDLARSLVR